MKKIYLLLILIISLSNCTKEHLDPNNVVDKQVDVLSEDILKIKFAKILSQALFESPELRKLIKSEALKRFDNDDEVLYQLIKKCPIRGTSLSDYLSRFADSEAEFMAIENRLPLLTILVPSLPNFSVDSWNTETEIPEVAVKIKDKKEIPLISYNGNQTTIPSGAIPGFPVLVVKGNERIYVSSSSLKSANLISNKPNGKFMFKDDSFDGSRQRVQQNRTPSPGETTDPANANAYNLGLEWQRDYVYYGLTPTVSRGSFRNNYSEYLTSMRLLGNWYEKIADQTGDPHIVSDLWTDGAFEFKVTVQLNATNGIGATIEKYISVEGKNLMQATYESARTGQRTWYYPTNIIGIEYHPDLELASWDLKNYGSAWKISIAEIDDTEEITHTEEITTTYAANFDVGGEKVGYKFGIAATSSVKSTFTVKTTKNSDELGNTILTFSDPIITGRFEEYNRRTNSYDYFYSKNKITTGWVELVIEPKQKW